MSAAPRCLVVGAGRIAGGFVSPLLRSTGWEVTLVTRNALVRDLVNANERVGVRIGTDTEDWVDGIRAVGVTGTEIESIAKGVDLFATSVGPSALDQAGRLLAPLVRRRLDATNAPVNIITFENHRQAPELLAAGLIDADPSLAAEIGRKLGIGGAAVWRAVSNRRLEADGVWFDCDDLDECYVDGRSLVSGAPPLGGEIPGISLVDTFEAWIVEKLWVFNAGHAAAAYLGWHAGCQTIDQAMAIDEIRDVVAGVVGDAQIGLEVYLAAMPGGPLLPHRRPEWILGRYADPLLADSVLRVGREPRRKLSAGDRLIGPALAAMAAGHVPVSLARAVSAALTYQPEGDRQASDLQFELELLGPEEVLAALAGLDATDELTRLIAERYAIDSTQRICP